MTRPVEQMAYSVDQMAPSTGHVSFHAQWGTVDLLEVPPKLRSSRVARRALCLGGVQERAFRSLGSSQLFFSTLFLDQVLILCFHCVTRSGLDPHAAVEVVSKDHGHACGLV